MSRPLPTEKALLRGAEGNIEVLIDAPETVRGIALVCHPHPLFGGATTNKGAHTLAPVKEVNGAVATDRPRAELVSCREPGMAGDALRPVGREHRQARLLVGEKHLAHAALVSIEEPPVDDQHRLLAREGGRDSRAIVPRSVTINVCTQVNETSQLRIAQARPPGERSAGCLR